MTDEPVTDEQGTGDDPTPAQPRIEIRRSRRRRRTVSAHRDGETTVVLMPTGLTPEQEDAHVRSLLARLERADRRRRPSDAELMDRATRLSNRWLAGRAVPTSVRWVGNQSRRWGSCTTTEGAIRLSDRLRGMPEYVIDAVLLHELAHLVEPHHGPAFHALLADYPDREKALGFLAGVTWASSP